MNNTIDKLGELTMKLRKLEKEKARLVDHIKSEMSGSVSYGEKYFVTLKISERTTIDKNLIPVELLARVSKTTEIKSLLVNVRA